MNHQPTKQSAWAYWAGEIATFICLCAMGPLSFATAWLLVGAP